MGQEDVLATCRSPAEEKAVVTEKLDQAQMGLLKSRGAEPASSLDGASSTTGPCAV